MAASQYDLDVEATLACGDTISLRRVPKVGTYRLCIHCDSSKRVESYVVRNATSPKPHWLEPLSLSDLLQLQFKLVEGHKRASGLYIWSVQHGMPAVDVGSLAEALHGLVTDVYERFSDLNGSEAIL